MQAPIIIDFEASGFGKDSYPIEVGFIGEAGQAWCALIKPENDWLHWDRHAADMHHISRDQLLQCGKPCAFVANHLNQCLEGRVVYTDGWMHDYIWMARLFDAAELSPHFQLEDLRRILTPEQERSWHATKAAVLADLHLTRHRASADALVLQLTWLRSHGTA
ncbi:MAG: hypothetical protein JO269_06435 [Burkholderiaceae bacterium]|nr:hypothetical protein [Burkholderiaceae bacterium]